jgi:hypothetical protein
MDRQHAAAIASVERSIKSSEVLRASLDEGEAIGRQLIAGLETGSAISSTIEDLGLSASTLRQNATQLLADYELRRHEMRITFIGAALDEGLSISEIARKLGVSRQLLQRYAHEARGGEQPEESCPK